MEQQKSTDPGSKDDTIPEEKEPRQPETPPPTPKEGEEIFRDLQSGSGAPGGLPNQEFH